MSRLPLMKSEIRNGADYMQIFPGLLLYSVFMPIFRANIKLVLYFVLFSDVVRELTDYSKFMLMPNDFKAFEDHFMKVS